MPNFQETVNKLVVLINEYITVRNLLFTNKYSYDNDAFIRRYNVREMGFTLYSSIEAARSASDYYRLVIGDPNFTKAQKSIINGLYAQLVKQCNTDGINYQPTAPLLQYIPNLGYPFGNVTKAVQQLHLLQEILNGFLRIGNAAQGKYLDLIISYTRSSGMATPYDQLIIDIDMLLADPGLVGHIMEHEIGHRDYAQYYGQSEPLNVTNLPFYRPSFISDNMTQPQRNEALADIYSNMVAAMFNIDLDNPYTRFLNQIAPIGADMAHPLPNSRADMIQKVFSTLNPLFTTNNSMWYSFAQAVRNIAGLTWDDLPTFADIDGIIKDFPLDKQRQKLALKNQFPRLYAPNNRGEYPPVARVDTQTLLKVLNPSLITQGIPFKPSDLTSIEQFQEANKNTILNLQYNDLTPVFTKMRSQFNNESQPSATPTPAVKKPQTKKSPSAHLLMTPKNAKQKTKTASRQNPSPLLFNQISPIKLAPLLPLIDYVSVNGPTGLQAYQAMAPSKIVPVQPLMLENGAIVTNLALGRVAWELFKNASKTVTKGWSPTNTPFTKMAKSSKVIPAQNVDEQTIRYLRA